MRKMRVGRVGEEEMQARFERHETEHEIRDIIVTHSLAFKHGLHSISLPALTSLLEIDKLGERLQVQGLESRRITSRRRDWKGILAKVF